MVTKRYDDRRRQGEYRAICLWKMDWQSFAKTSKNLLSNIDLRCFVAKQFLSRIYALFWRTFYTPKKYNYKYICRFYICVCIFVHLYLCLYFCSWNKRVCLSSLSTLLLSTVDITSCLLLINICFQFCLLINIYLKFFINTQFKDGQDVSQNMPELLTQKCKSVAFIMTTSVTMISEI